nr:uncharacterized protein LOC117274971 [Nicotiana tomentosiformis]
MGLIKVRYNFTLTLAHTDAIGLILDRNAIFQDSCCLNQENVLGSRKYKEGSRAFNVYHFIVSQEHPHIASLLQIQEFDGAYGGTVVHDCVNEYFSDYNETIGGECNTSNVLASKLEDKIHKNKKQHKVLEFVCTIQVVWVILGMDYISTITVIRSSLNDPTGVQSHNLFTNTL